MPVSGGHDKTYAIFASEVFRLLVRLRIRCLSSRDDVVCLLPAYYRFLGSGDLLSGSSMNHWARQSSDDALDACLVSTA